MQNFIINPKKNLNSEVEIELIPINLNKDLKKGNEIEFNNIYVLFHPLKTLLFFEKYVVPRLLDEALDLINYEPHSSLEMARLNEIGLKIKAGESLNSEQIKALKFTVKILSVSVYKNVLSKFNIEALVLDPLKRLWRISPGHYCEGWFNIKDDFDGKMLEYAKINNLELSKLIRKNQSESKSSSCTGLLESIFLML